MAEQLVLKPSEFQTEIDTYKTQNAKLENVKFEAKPENVVLDSFDKIQECVDTFNRIVKKMNSLGQDDVKNMQNIKSAWMKLDEEIGEKTFGETLFGK